MNWLVDYTNEPVINAGRLQTGKPVFTPKKDTRFWSRLKNGDNAGTRWAVPPWAGNYHVRARFAPMGTNLTRHPPQQSVSRRRAILMSKRAALRLTDLAYQSSYTAKRMKKYILTSVSLFQNETSIVYSMSLIINWISKI